MSLRLLACFLTFLLASCGGGGGSSSGSSSSSSGGGMNPPGDVEFSLINRTLQFTAQDLVSAPSRQSLSARVNPRNAGGTLYILVTINGPAVQDVGLPNVGPNNIGYVEVYPQDPNLLGPGTHTATLTVRACMDSPNCASGELTGSPSTATATYTIAPHAVARDLVFPRVAVAGSAGTVIIRGANLSSVSSVHFGLQAATTFTIVSGTEIRANYPAMAAGLYDVRLNGAAIPFSADLAVTEPQSYVDALLSYPSASVSSPPASPKYDAERRAIYLALHASDMAQNRLVKYSYGATGWSSPEAVSIPNLRDVIISPTGSHLLGYAGNSILEIDPVTLATTGTFDVPPHPFQQLDDLFINSLALANDGKAMLMFGCRCGSSSVHAYFFNMSTHEFKYARPDPYLDAYRMSISGADAPRIFASADGSQVRAAHLLRYDPSTGGLARLPLMQGGLTSSNRLPHFEMSRHGTRFALAGIIDSFSGSSPVNVDVYDGNNQRLGRIAEPTFQNIQNRHAVVAPDGSRVYVFHVDQQQQQSIVAISTFDITTTVPVTAFPQIGARVSVTPMPRVNPFAGVTITPEGRTLLMASDAGVFVQPVP
ncbi:MAG TPA: IPT/TIG domain-containing protein [Steroidobacteraceae bacterium]|nr:IPT/TIG domain-containing protein [Steroidobacteraceae bacterium]